MWMKETYPCKVERCPSVCI